MYAVDLDKNTGELITDSTAIKQAISDILFTPIGERVMRREFGSLLADLIDEPQTETTALKMMAAVVIALNQFEPRLSVIQVQIEQIAASDLKISVRYQLKNSVAEAQEVAVFKVSR